MGAFRLAVAIAATVAVAACSSSGTDTAAAPAVTTILIASTTTTSTTTTAPTDPTTTSTTPATTTTAPAEPVGLDAATIEFIEVTLQDPPAFPEVADYSPSGEPVTDTVRLFGDGIPATYGTAAVNRCEQGVWIARWRSLGPDDIPIVATRAVAGLATDPVASDLPAANAGYRGHLGGSQCAVPAFYTQTPTSGTIVDIVVEYQRYEISPNEAGVTDEPVTAAPAPEFISCSAYDFAFDLPLRQCDSGGTVRYAQEQLAELGFLDPLAVDSFYGADTAAAVYDYQTSVDLVADAVIGTNTWNRLMQGVGLPGNDFNNDGVIQPDELGE